MYEYYDYIIIGAGSAGCVLANRLSANPKQRILLIEAGGSDKHLFIRMPAALSYPMNMPRFDWGYHSQAEPHLNNRKLACPRGKVLGGSSSINGMVYVRGHARDFDRWSALGAKGWSYQDCLPYFKKAESWQGEPSEFRGDNGPLTTCHGNQHINNPLYQAFIQAGHQAGYPVIDDYNGAQQSGFSLMQMTVHKGSRCSAAAAYIHPIKHRRNLHIITNATVNKILINNKTAVGIEFRHQHKIKHAHAACEVICCAGAIGSPVILQRSGIGPRETLQNSNIPIVHVLAGVGRNLQDHIEVYFQYRCKQAITLNSRFDWLNKSRIGMQWLLTKKGLGATNHFEACGFIKSSPHLDWPDIQYHFLPAAIRYDGGSPIDGHGYQVHVGPNKPYSRGSVMLTHSHIDAPPHIQFNYLQDHRDIKAWRFCIRLTRRLLQQPAFDPFRGEAIQPPENVQSDNDIDQWVKANVESAYHPSGSCKMGSIDDPMSVVDSNARVIGIQRLRIVDASIFPEITNGNLNAPTIMVAEKIADSILQASISQHEQDNIHVADHTRSTYCV